MCEQNEIMVSVFCLAFNHENYIRQTIDSILNQQTSFSFEILIHDDASTDRTAEIIREYEHRAPGIVRPIYQQNNQHSQGKNILHEFMMPLARGKYFAFCECDDYWIDPDKLQKQVDYLERHPDCTLCIHNACTVDTGGNRTGVVHPVEHSGTVSCETVIRRGGGYCATNSIVAPLERMRDCPPYVWEFALDYIWQTYLASCGSTYCFAEEMSAYRQGDAGSWTARMKAAPEKYEAFLRRLHRSMAAFDEYTGGRYTETVRAAEDERYCRYYLQAEDYQKLTVEPYRSIWKNDFSAKTKIKILLGIHCPSMLRLAERLRGR